MGQPAKDSIVSYFRSSDKGLPVVRDDSDMTILKFLHAVKEGYWREKIESIRACTTKTEKDRLKKRLPAISTSGVFKDRRKPENLLQHSGFICIDFDGIPDMDKAVEQLQNDEYTFALFKSAGGKGLACFVKIDTDPHKHKGAFRRLSDHYSSRYQLFADKRCSDITRLRFASWDADLYHNPDAKKWTKTAVAMLERQEAKLNLNIVATPSDVEAILEQIESRHIDMTSNYDDWIAIGFALVDGFGESGREIYHRVSAIDPRYDPEQTNRKYTNFINTYKDSGIKIGRFYNICISNGIQVNSEKTRKAVSVATIKKNKEDCNYKTARSYIARQLDMPMEDAEHVVKAVWESKAVDSGLNMPSKVHLYIEHNFVREYNELTEELYVNGKPLTDAMRGEIIMQVRQMYGDKAALIDIKAALDNHLRVKKFHPIRDYFNNYKSEPTTGHIDKLLSSLPCKNTIGNMVSTQYRNVFGRKWFIRIARAIDGYPNQLVLALIGAQGTGKTYFFNHLLPDELSEYFDNTTLDYADKQTIDLKLSRNIILNDDEGGSKTRREAKRFKMLTSLPDVTGRKLYSQQLVTRPRLASFCMTSNEIHILNDDTGNRRIIPIDIGDDYIDWDVYNSVDKEALWREVWAAYKAGETGELTREETALFMSSFKEFKVVDDLEEAINHALEKTDKNCEPVAFAEIQKHLQFHYPCARNIAKGVLGKKLTALKFESTSVRLQINGQRELITYYFARIKDSPTNHQGNILSNQI